MNKLERLEILIELLENEHMAQNLTMLIGRSDVPGAYHMVVGAILYCEEDNDPDYFILYKIRRLLE